MIKDRHKLKRRVAFISFGVIIFTLVFVLLASIFGNENTARILTAASGIIVTVLACLTSLIGAWAGLSHHDDMRNGDN